MAKKCLLLVSVFVMQFPLPGHKGKGDCVLKIFKGKGLDVLL